MHKLNPAKKNILVTGGAGFIGSHIVDRLLARGDTVIIADDLSTGRKENINPKARFYKVDISDKKAVHQIFRNHRIDYCIHEAAKINLNVMLEDPDKDVRSTVLGTVNLLKHCIDFKVKKFIYASSVAVYGRPYKLPVAEDNELAPVYSYGIAKKCAEEYVRYYSDYYNLNYSILRYANVYGPRQPIYGEVGIIAIFTEKSIKGKELVIYRDGTHLRDYVYIDDVVDITIRTLNCADREILNIGYGSGVSVNDIFRYFCEANNKKLKHKHRPERIGELGRFYCDINKLVKIIKLKPRVSIKKGIFETVSYYKRLSSKIISDDISLRPVSPKDRKMIFKWRNTPFLIKRGSTKKAVKWDEHCKWFDGVINNDSVKLFIINYHDIPVGQVRFERAIKGTYRVSIYLLERYTGKGIGLTALMKGLEAMATVSPSPAFVALVKSDNLTSLALFSKAGFKKDRNYSPLPHGHIAMKYSKSR